MRLATIRTETALLPVVQNASGQLIELSNTIRNTCPDSAADLKSVIANWETIGESVRTIASGTDAGLDPESANFAATVPNAEKIICIGLNYADHAAETGAAIPSLPVVFNKFPTALIGHGDPIELPAISSQVDFEAELVVVIGREAKNVSRKQAMDHVFGYCCGHDVSARDWQKGRPGGQWLLGKTFDTFAPLGPWLVTADAISDPGNLNVKLQLNGETMQDGSTNQFIFAIDHLIAHLSQFSTLKPGDLIFTGTPPGVGMARDPQVFLKSGDTVAVEVEGLGLLSNPVIG